MLLSAAAPYTSCSRADRTTLPTTHEREPPEGNSRSAGTNRPRAGQSRCSPSIERITTSHSRTVVRDSRTIPPRPGRTPRRDIRFPHDYTNGSDTLSCASSLVPPPSERRIFSRKSARAQPGFLALSQPRAFAGGGGPRGGGSGRANGCAGGTGPRARAQAESTRTRGAAHERERGNTHRGKGEGRARACFRPIGSWLVGLAAPEPRARGPVAGGGEGWRCALLGW